MKGNLIPEDVRLTYNGYNNSVTICFKEEKYDYDYMTGEYRYITVYEDCHSASIYKKVPASRVLPTGALIIDDNGEEISDADYILIPCDSDTFQ